MVKFCFWSKKFLYLFSRQIGPYWREFFRDIWIIRKPIQTILSQIFHDNFSSLNVKTVIVMHCTIFSIWYTINFFKFRVTIRASIWNHSWWKFNSLNDRFNIFSNISYKIQRFLITWSIPQLSWNIIAWIQLNHKISLNRCLFNFTLRRGIHPFF